MASKYKEVNGSVTLIRIGEVARMVEKGLKIGYISTYMVTTWMKKGLINPAYEIKRPDGKIQRYFSVPEVQQFLTERKANNERKKLEKLKLLTKKYDSHMLIAVVAERQVEEEVK